MTWYIWPRKAPSNSFGHEQSTVSTSRATTTYSDDAYEYERSEIRFNAENHIIIVSVSIGFLDISFCISHCVFSDIVCPIALKCGVAITVHIGIYVVYAWLHYSWPRKSPSNISGHEDSIVSTSRATIMGRLCVYVRSFKDPFQLRVKLLL